jgi:arsenate reductase-like glutaredoxin family protein
MRGLRLYGRAQCHLCEEMARALRAAGVAFDEVDVDSDPALRARFGDLVPVLADAAGNELCRTRLDAATLGRIK